MFIKKLKNGNFAVMDSKNGKTVFMCECESYDVTMEMKSILEVR